MRCFSLGLIAAIALLSQTVFAKEGPLKDISFGIGNLSQFIGRVQTDDQGSHNSLEFNPVFGAEARIDFNPSWSIAPEFAIGLPRSGRDENIKKLTYWFSGSLGYSIGDYILQAGLGLHMNRVWADGGTQKLPNGAGTDNFPMPQGSATATNLTTHLGLRYYFLADWSAKLQSHFYNTFDSDQRAVSLVLMINYHLGDLFMRKGHE